MQQEADQSVGNEVHDLMSLSDEVLRCWDEFPPVSGVVSPMDALILKYGKPAVDQAVAFIRRLGLLESEVQCTRKQSE